MKLFLILIISTLGITFSAHAEPTKKRTCRIVYPERPNDAPKTAFLFDGTGSQPVDLPSMNFSEVITLPEGQLIIALTPTAIIDADGLPASAPKLEIAETVRDFYILITPDPSNPTLPLEMKLVSASDGNLNPGETLWSNFTDHEIVATLGEHELSVAPKSLTVSKEPVQNSGYYKAVFSFHPNGKGDLQMITEQNWWHDSKCRHLGFIVDSGAKLPKIYFYRDFR